MRETLPGKRKEDEMVRYYRLLYLSLFIFSAVFGCTIAPKPTLQQDEDMLANAGFTLKPADTPEKMGRLKKLPQKKLFQQKINGKVYYLYADAVHCQCLYRGDEGAYNNYQELVREQKREAKIELYTQQNEDMIPPAAEDWAGLLDD